MAGAIGFILSFLNAIYLFSARSLELMATILLILLKFLKSGQVCDNSVVLRTRAYCLLLAIDSTFADEQLS